MCDIGEPADGLQAKFSVRHVVAMALAGVDTRDIHNFGRSVSEDPVVAALRRKVVVSWGEGLPLGSGAVVVTTADGRTYREEAVLSSSATDLPAQGRAVTAKFRSLADPVLGGEAVEQVIREVESLGERDSLDALLTALAVPPRG